MILPKLVITDIDGVWTDGGMYYDQHGNELKKFNTSDSAGVLFLHLLDIPIAIISGEDTEIVRRRAEKLKIDFVYLGIQDKVATTEQLIQKLGIQWSDIAFIGDDINDMLLLEKVGFSATPNNAPDYIKKIVHHTIPVNGGAGAFRFFTEYILKENDLLDKALSLYRQSIS